MENTKYFAFALRSAPVRYVLAAAVMLLAVALRLALIPILGLNIPYVTVYPAMMFTAIALGAGPGVGATLLGVWLAERYLVAPTGIRWDLSFAIRAAIPLLTSLYVGWVSGRLRRARTNADAEAQTARTAEAALRQQLELVDSARAEVIGQEMQRVLRARQTAVPPPPATPGAWLRRVPEVSGFLVAGVGLMVIAGWALDLRALESVLPGMATMKLNTALSFVLAGVALVRREQRVLRHALALVVGILAALTLVEYALGVNIGIDQLLVRDPGDPQTVPGRMAQATAIAFVLSGAALLLLTWRGQLAVWTQQAFGVSVASVGIVTLLGYLYEAEQLFRVLGSTSVALPTAASLAVLGAGLICAHPEGVAGVLATTSPGSQLARRLLPAALGVPVALGLVHVLGERAGVHTSATGAGVFALAMILSLGAVTWWTALALNREDSARRQVESELRSQSELMAHAQEGLIIRELGGGILFWNQGAAALYGWTAAEAVGQRVGVLLRADRHLIEEEDAQLERAGRWDGELILTSRDGRRVIVESSATARPTNDGRVLILESTRDITARRQAEADRRELNASLELRVGARTAELREAAGYARSLIEASLDPLVTISPRRQDHRRQRGHGAGHRRRARAADRHRFLGLLHRARTRRARAISRSSPKGSCATTR